MIYVYTHNHGLFNKRVFWNDVMNREPSDGVREYYCNRYFIFFRFYLLFIFLLCKSYLNECICIFQSDNYCIVKHRSWNTFPTKAIHLLPYSMNPRVKNTFLKLRNSHALFSIVITSGRCLGFSPLFSQNLSRRMKFVSRVSPINIGRRPLSHHRWRTRFSGHFPRHPCASSESAWPWENPLQLRTVYDFWEPLVLVITQSFRTKLKSTFCSWLGTSIICWYFKCKEQKNSSVLLIFKKCFSCDCMGNIESQVKDQNGKYIWSW